MKTLIFDCDGVILDSNKLKTQAFYNTVAPYGQKEAEAFVNYHITHGGISRYSKFQHYLAHICKTQNGTPSIDDLLKVFAHEVHTGLMGCAIAGELSYLRKQSIANWMVVSGGDQNELRDVFGQRGIDIYFNGGIFGSPTAKKEILQTLLDRGAIHYPGAFLGDSKLDHEVAMFAGLNFVFVSRWTEFEGWKEYCHKHSIATIRDLAELPALEFPDKAGRT